LFLDLCFMKPHDIAIAVEAHHKDEGGNKKDEALSCGLPEEHLQADDKQLFKILEERHFLTRKGRFFCPNLNLKLQLEKSYLI